MPAGFKHRSHEQVEREREAGAKVCSRCEEIRVLGEFYSAPRSRDGLQSWCKACYREVRRTRYLTSTQRQRARSRPRAVSSGPRIRKPRLTSEEAKAAKAERHRRWREKNKEHVRAKWREWERSRRDLTVARTNRRRTLVLGAKGTASAEQIQARVDLFGGKCWICCAPSTAIDHVIPLSRNGTNWPSNLRPICKPCNSRKHNKMPKEVTANRASFF